MADGPATGSDVPDPERSADVENTMLAVLVPGTHVSGIDVSVDRSGWRERGCSVALDAFPTVNGTGVSARGRPI